jgi:hypothetical protein
MKGKPHFSTQGQSTKARMGPKNKKQGGAPGQNTSSRNRPCKPHFGTQGQEKAGGASGGGSTGKRAADVY